MSLFLHYLYIACHCITTPCCGFIKHCCYVRFYITMLNRRHLFLGYFLQFQEQQSSIVILSRLHCTLYSNNMAATILNIDSTQQQCHCHTICRIQKRKRHDMKKDNRDHSVAFKMLHNKMRKTSSVNMKVSIKQEH